MMIVTYHSVEVTLFEIIFLQASHSTPNSKRVLRVGMKDLYSVTEFLRKVPQGLEVGVFLGNSPIK